MDYLPLKPDIKNQRQTGCWYSFREVNSQGESEYVSLVDW